MSTRAGLRRRLAALEAEGITTRPVVAFYVTGPEGQVWLLLRDGRRFEGDEAVDVAATAEWPDVGFGGILRIIGIDADVVCGRKPTPDAETMRRWKSQIYGATT